MPKTSFARTPVAGASAPAPSPRPANAQAAAPAPRPRGAAPTPAPRPTATAPAPRAAAAPAPRPAARPVDAPEAEAPVVDVETTEVPPETTPAPTAAPAPAGRVRRTKAQIAADEAAAAPQTAVVVREDRPVGEHTGGLTPVGTITGEMDQSDLKLPQLKICSGDTSALARLDEPIPQGVICVGTGDQWAQLWFPKDAQYDASEPIGVTVLRADKTFVQTHNEKGQSLYDLELQGMTFRTKEEMQAAGGTLAQVLGMLPCEPQLVAHALIVMPEGFDDTLGIFGLETPDGLATQAMWYIRGSTYGDCAKKIFTERTGHLKNGSHTGEFNMSGKRIIGTKNSWWIPTIANGRLHSPEMVAFLQENA